MNYKNLFSNKNMRIRLLNFLRFIPDKPMLKLEYRIRMGRRLNLKNPQTFTEKLQWIKLYDRKDEYTQMVDKLLMKNIVESLIGKQYVVPVYGIWNKAEEIDFDSLPNQFVLKCNHDSGSVIICKDKKNFNKEEAIKKLNNSLRSDCYLLGREWPYKNVKHRIFAEKYLLEDSEDDEIVDYKFFCFNGKPKMMYISNDKGVVPQTDFFDMDFNHLPFHMQDPNALIEPQKPKTFNKMKELAELFSNGIKHLRVDFYVINDNIYVGEFTFFHGSGLVGFHPEEWDYRIGKWLDLKEE